MHNLKVDSQYSLEVVSEMIRYMNSICNRVQNIKNKISLIDQNEIWVCTNADVYKTKCIYQLDNCLKECTSANELIKLLVKNLENYKELDDKVIQSLYGNMRI